MSEMSPVALVTGASRGVGRGIALRLAEAGWDIVVNYRSEEKGARETAKAIENLGRGAWLAQADVGSSADVARMFKMLHDQHARLHALVNNSGVQTWSPMLELKEEDFDRTIRTNLKGSFLCTQHAARWMKETAGGSIVNIGSGANKTPFPNLVDYCCSKGGIDQLTRVAAVELGPLGIRVNCVAPGAIEIERTKEEDPDYAGTWGAITPCRRVGNARDVGEAVLFFVNPASEFITGQTLYVDGGLWTQGVWPYKQSST